MLHDDEMSQKLALSSDRAVFTAYLHVKSPEAVAREVKTILHILFRRADVSLFDRVLADVTRLFRGQYPGYRSCNTEYHDLTHTLDVLLATARLIHGAHVEGIPFTPEDVLLALTAALLHDVGYLQSDGDEEGTGAKYTLIHVRRGVDFVTGYFLGLGLDERQARNCQSLIWCTDLAKTMEQIEFLSPQCALLGRILGTADLLGQMADDIYLEKLTDLYDEFAEGQVPGFSSEMELVHKTLGFFSFIQARLRGQLGGLHHCMRSYFRVRHCLDRDLYDEYMRKNIFFLTHTLHSMGEGYRLRLRRGRHRSRVGAINLPALLPVQPS